MQTSPGHAPSPTLRTPHVPGDDTGRGSVRTSVRSAVSAVVYVDSGVLSSPAVLSAILTFSPASAADVAIDIDADARGGDDPAVVLAPSASPLVAVAALNRSAQALPTLRKTARTTRVEAAVRAASAAAANGGSDGALADAAAVRAARVEDLRWYAARVARVADRPAVLRLRKAELLALLASAGCGFAGRDDEAEDEQAEEQESCASVDAP